jgi:hypothetical protein
VVATAATPENRLSTAVMMTAAFTVLIIIVMALWSYRPAWVTRWTGPLKELAPEDRQLVIRAVRLGESVFDPRLAQVAVAAADRTARRAWLMIGAGGLMVGVRAWSLVDSDSTAGRVMGALSAAFWLACLVYGIRLRSRACRAEAANLAVLTHM